MNKTFFQCRNCIVVVKCLECGSGPSGSGSRRSKSGGAAASKSRSDEGQMTSKITTEKGKCYHDIQDTFNMSDEWMYFNVGYRNGNKKENLHATCFECKKVLLWDAKRK
jgi:hypothetical protein